MRLTCPCCGAVNSIEAVLSDLAARDAVVAALSLPNQLGERVLRYIGLFRPRERAISWDRAAKLLGELQAPIQTAHIERHGQVYPAPLDYWKLALDQMLDSRDKLALPLKTHGYLFEIVVGLSQKAQDRQAARQEIANERASARDGERTGPIPALDPRPSPQPLSPRGRGAAGPRDAQGEGESRPARCPPPPEFKALLAKLKGKTDAIKDEKTHQA